MLVVQRSERLRVALSDRRQQLSIARDLRALAHI